MVMAAGAFLGHRPVAAGRGPRGQHTAAPERRHHGRVFIPRGPQRVKIRADHPQLSEYLFLERFRDHITLSYSVGHVRGCYQPSH